MKGFEPVIDENTGKITGYKTAVGGADTVFPFSDVVYELVWENNSGADSGSSHDISQYKYVVIGTTYQGITDPVVENFVDTSKSIGSIYGAFLYNSSIWYGSMRTFTITNGILKFASTGRAGSQPSAGSDLCLPRYIYGIR